MTSTFARMVYCARGLGFTEPPGPLLDAAIDKCMGVDAGPGDHPKPRIRRDTESVHWWQVSERRWICESFKSGDYRITARGATRAQAFVRWLDQLCELAKWRTAQQHDGWEAMEAAATYFSSFLLDAEELDDFDFRLDIEGETA